MDAGIYVPLFLVLVAPEPKTYSIFYLPANLQKPEMFQPRPPLPQSAQRPGWQGFMYNLELKDRFVRFR